MQVHGWVFEQEVLDLAGLVGRKVVENDVDLLLWWARAYHLSKKIHELLSGVPRGRLALDLARAHIQCCIEGKGAVAIVFESMAFDPTG